MNNTDHFILLNVILFIFRSPIICQYDEWIENNILISNRVDNRNYTTVNINIRNSKTSDDVSTWDLPNYVKLIYCQSFIIESCLKRIYNLPECKTQY